MNDPVLDDLACPQCKGIACVPAEFPSYLAWMADRGAKAMRWLVTARGPVQEMIARIRR
jgi:hypothetical protein